jgi:hypothetical protein
MNLSSTIQAYGTSEGVSKAWDERGRGRKQLSDKAQRALATYVPATQEKQRMAEQSEQIIAKAIGGQVTHNNSPFDVIKGKVAIEVKTMFPGIKHNKITMHPEARQRKLKTAKKLKLSAYTVIVDRRDNSIYVAKGVGSFRLGHGSTEEVSLKDLAGKLK